MHNTLKYFGCGDGKRHIIGKRTRQNIRQVIARKKERGPAISNLGR